MSKLSVISANICGLNNNIKCKRMVAHLHKLIPDISMTHLKKGVEVLLKSRKYPHQQGERGLDITEKSFRF